MIDFSTFKKEYKDSKGIIVRYNDISVNKRITLNYEGINNKIEHAKDVFVLSEAISILIRDYKKQGNNDAILLKAVVENLENNFIEVVDNVVRK